ncbi:MAG: ATP-binding protein [Magnetovibrio sp.]|nr:ATP-binding protein [Magnetovibrio sp.]
MILVVVVPLAGFQFYSASEEKIHRTKEASRVLEHSTVEAVSKISDLISSSEELLAGLAVTDAVLGRNVFSCTRVLRQVAAKFKKYTNFSVVNADKFIVCSSGSLPQPKFIGQSSNIQEAFKTKSFAVSPFKFGVLTGKPVLVFSMPLLDGDGEVAGTVNNGLSLTWLGKYLSAISTVVGQRMLVIDGKGTVMASHPENLYQLGSSVAKTHLGTVLQGRAAGTVHYTDEQGEDMLVSVSSISRIPGGAQVVAIAPLKPMMLDVLSNLYTHLALITVAAAVSLILGWLSARVMLLNPIANLTALAGRIEKGDLRARSEQSYVTGELGTLAWAYDQMAASLESRTDALQLSEKHYRELVESEEQLIHRFYPDTTEVFVNQALANFYGNETKDWVGKRWIDFINADERHVVENFLSSRTPDNPSYIHEHMAKNAAGEERWLRWNNIAFFDDDGVITHFQAVGLDLTDRKKVERSLELAMMEARAANLAKSNFMANMSHELRTPLNSIIGFSEMMSSGVMGELPGKCGEYTSFITSSGHHLLNIINDILDLSKIEAGMLQLDESTVYLRNEVEEVMAMVQAQAQKENNTLIDKLDDANAFVLRADRMRIKQVLLNLLSNAVKFTHEGTITLSGEIIDGKISLKVSDTGIGMTEKDIKVALSPFGQVDGQHLNKRYEGTGLGLPLAEQLMDLHDGTLNIESMPGQGTTVIMTFPAERTVTGEDQLAE